MSRAYLDSEQLRTSAGLLSIRHGTNIECRDDAPDCKVLGLNGRVLLHDFIVSLAEVIPSASDPKLVMASTANGGSCCPSSYHILDLTKSPPILVKNVPEYAEWKPEAKISYDSDGITYKGFSTERTEFGEPIWKVYRYKFGSRRVEIVHSTILYNFSPLNLKNTLMIC
jgi:hypothetical protein